MSDEWYFCWREIAPSCPAKEADDPSPEHVLVVEQNPVTGEYRKRRLSEVLPDGG